MPNMTLFISVIGAVVAAVGVFATLWPKHPVRAAVLMTAAPYTIIVWGLMLYVLKKLLRPLKKNLESVKKRLDLLEKRLDFKFGCKENLNFAESIYETARTLKRGNIYNLYLRPMDMTPDNIIDIDTAYKIKHVWDSSDLEFDRIITIDAPRKIDWAAKLMKTFGAGEIRRFHLWCFVTKDVEFQPGLNVLVYHNPQDKVYMGMLSIRTESGDSPTAGFTSRDEDVVFELAKLCIQARRRAQIINTDQEIEELRTQIG